MSRLKTLVRNQNGVPPLRGGHSLCQGCGIPLVVRTVLSTIERPVVVVNATGCLEVATTRYPSTAWNVPWLHVAFENAAAVASGVESAQRALARRNGLPSTEVAVVVFAGDGGTYDIGLQALSGAMERGHDFLFVCYDNEAYMNTGIQRSGATPFGASTTTSPAGSESFGKAQRRKDMTAIAVGTPRAVRRTGRREPLARLEPQGLRRGRRSRPGVPQRSDRLPGGLGTRAAADAPRAERRGRLSLLAALRGRRRSLHIELRPEPADSRRRLARGCRSGSRICSSLMRVNGSIEIQQQVDGDWADLVGRCTS